MSLKATCSTLAKVDEHEEIFALRAKDQSAPKVIALWIAENIETAPDEKLMEALACALLMRRQHGRKAAD